VNPLAAGYLSSVPPNPGFILFRAPSARVSDLMRRMLTRDRATLTPRFVFWLNPNDNWPTRSPTQPSHQRSASSWGRKTAWHPSARVF